MIRLILLLAFILPLAACFELTPDEREYRNWLDQRVLIKICMSGARIYKWKDAYYTISRFEKVSGPEICN